MSLMQAAYVEFDGGRLDTTRVAPIEGAPSWAESDRYDINATADAAYSRDMMMGPMLQGLLADRFHLKIRRELRQMPFYTLKVADGGLKLPRFPEGSCVPIDFRQFFDAIERVKRNGQAFEPMFHQGTNYCPNRGSGDGPLNVVEAQGSTIEEFSRIFLREVNGPIVDRTGLSGLFNFHLEYAPPGIAAALEQQLGLKLEQGVKPQEVLVIDRIEKPAN
jgi:uncharacterized protein (TIGR03435 family)